MKTNICFSSKALYKGDEKHINVGSLGDNKPFNRFKNILPCKFTVTAKRTYVIVAILLDDDNRVLLKKLDHELCVGDYINASYIDVRIQQLNHYDYCFTIDRVTVWLGSLLLLKVSNDIVSFIINYLVFIV